MKVVLVSYIYVNSYP